MRARDTSSQSLITVYFILAEAGASEIRRRCSVYCSIWHACGLVIDDGCSSDCWLGRGFRYAAVRI